MKSKSICQIPPDAQCVVAKAIIPYIVTTKADWEIKSLFDVLLRSKWIDMGMTPSRKGAAHWTLKYGKQDWSFKQSFKGKWSYTGHGTDLR